jgi:hypothetical protein
MRLKYANMYRVAKNLDSMVQLIYFICAFTLSYFIKRLDYRGKVQSLYVYSSSPYVLFPGDHSRQKQKSMINNHIWSFCAYLMLFTHIGEIYYTKRRIPPLRLEMYIS